MKKCPNCQKTFDVDKRFCQIDGTPLIDVFEPPPAEDPFKTVVVGKQDIPLMGNDSEDQMKTTVIRGDAKDDDILQIPEVFDPMKTMVVSEPIKFDIPKETPKFEEHSASLPEPPKFNEPNITPPNFGDLSKTEEPKIEQPKIETPIVNPFSAPPKFDQPIANPFSDPPKVDSPFSSPVIESPKFDSNPLPSQNPPVSSPFDTPKNEPIQSPFEVNLPEPPPYKEPDTPFGVPPSPFDPTPFGQNEPKVNQPVQQMEWNPPNPPVQDWQDQNIGAKTPFQSPQVGTGVENKTLATVSLVLGILSFLCLGPLGAIGAIITGYMQKGKIKNNPGEYGGGGFATIGIILGVVNIILSILVTVVWILLVTRVIQF